MERKAGKAQGMFRALLTPPFRFLWSITTEGMERLPDSGGAIIAPNHISVLDSFFVPLVLPRRITYVGKAEYMDSWKTKYVFPAMGMVPIDRSGGDAAKGALDTAAEVLGAGELFGIYPEGTRARDGLLHKGHTGIARLALRTGAPIVPVGIIGTKEVQPPDAKVPKPFMRVHLRFGDPVDVARYADRADDRLVLRQITDEIMFEIAALSGQSYVDTYATKPSRTPEPDGVAAPAPLRVDSPPEAVPGVAQPGRRSAVAALAPSAATPSREAARELVRLPPETASGASAGDEADGVERRSSASVLKSRPLVAV
ncbi:MAG: lysophospholipid acyltransferase family protein [Microthrixaceae bacterium]